MKTKRNIPLAIAALIGAGILFLLFFQGITKDAEPVEITDFESCVAARNPVMESYPRQCRAGDKTFVEYIGNELEKIDLIRSNFPRPNQEITSPLVISGEARGFWFFEGDFPVKLLDENGEVLVESFATAQGNWMTEEFVLFRVEFEFNAPDQKGTLILEKDNPSGLAENADELRIPVKIKENASSQNTETVIIKNQGEGMGGHTPRGFKGQGTGLFAGDNLNPDFPDGDGVQIFLTFDIRDIADQNITSATLRTQNAHVQGTPYQDLGTLRVEEVHYEEFSSKLWNLESASDFSCVFATSVQGPFECDVTEIVENGRTYERKDDRKYAQFRLKFDRAGDSDGSLDLASFFITNSNTNEPGIFELEIKTELGTISSSDELGTLVGFVNIGPICPVEREGIPCNILPEVYTSRELIIYKVDGTTEVARTFYNPNGTFTIKLAPGTYSVDIAREGIDSASSLPQEIIIVAGETVELNFSIDTGIR